MTPASLLFCAALLLAAPGDPEAGRELRPDVPVAVACTAEGAAFRYTAGFLGRLELRAEAAGFDPVIAVEWPGDPGREPLASPAGHRRAFLSVPVAPGRELSIRLRGAEGPATCTARRVPEEPAALALAGRLRRGLPEIEALLGRGEWEAVWRALEEAGLEIGRAEPEPVSPALGDVLWELGERAAHAGERALAAAVWERSLALRRRHWPADHPRLARLELELAVLRSDLGEEPRASALGERAVATLERLLPGDDPELVEARLGLLKIRFRSGGYGPAEDLLDRLESSLAGSLAPGDPGFLELRLWRVRLLAEGDPQAALGPAERTLELGLAHAPAGDPGLLAARLILGLIQLEIGSLHWARFHLDEVVRRLAERVPPGNRGLLQARLVLGNALSELGYLGEALAIYGEVEDTLPDSLPETDRLALAARLDRAWALRAFDVLAARRAIEEVHAIYARNYPPDHPSRLQAQYALGCLLSDRRLDEGERGLALLQDLEDRIRRVVEEDHPWVQMHRESLIFLCARLGRRQECARLLRESADSLAAGLERTALRLPPREAEDWVFFRIPSLGLLLSLADGAGYTEPFPGLDEAAFALVEGFRGVGIEAARSRLLAGPEGLQRRLQRASERVSESIEDGRASAVLQAQLEKKRIARELAHHCSEAPGGAHVQPPLTSGTLAERLGPGEAAVGFWRTLSFRKSRITIEGYVASARLLAFVVRPGQPLARVDLGRQDVLAEACGEWLGAVQAGTSLQRAAGERLRALIFNPLEPHLEGVRTLIVAPDDVLHQIPLDALPLPDGDRVVGDVLAIEVRLTLRELLREEPRRAGDVLLVAGGIDYGEPEPGAGRPSFTPLPATRDEVVALADLYRETRGGPVLQLDGARAGRGELAREAPRARFLHLATHGYVAPQVAPAEESASARRDRQHFGSLSAGAPAPREIVAMARCRLALAGANRGPAGDGRGAGELTAEELATWDLSNCELAVLSACSTNDGGLSPGQGVDSFQKALQMAGAGTVLTSLWRVPDPVTQELMKSFYGHLWRDGMPARRALWEAKRDLRRRNAPAAYWAGWVLSGGSR